MRETGNSAAKLRNVDRAQETQQGDKEWLEDIKLEELLAASIPSVWITVKSQRSDAEEGSVDGNNYDD